MNLRIVPEGLLKDREKLVNLIYRLLQDILKATSELPRGNSTFHARQIPAMPIQSYLLRLSKYCHCSTATYVIALVYIDRLQEALEDFMINYYCIHKLLICSLALAAKFNDDEFYKNNYYAKVGGISLQQMNTLELNFSILLNYNFWVKPAEFVTYLEKLNEYDCVKE